MFQILFRIPIKDWFGIGWNIPIHGYGFMLFVAFVSCLLLGMRLAKARKISVEIVQDLAIWIFIPGIIGARFVFVFEKPAFFIANPLRFFAVWDGGLVFYGSAIGGLVGFLLAYRRILKPNRIPVWTMADILAPCIALGLCLGRIGCLLNGCCYGHVACPECPPATAPFYLSVPPAVSFPLSTAPRKELVRNGLQTAAGFVTYEQSTKVKAVEPSSPAARAGLKANDEIRYVNENETPNYSTLYDLLTDSWERGESLLRLKVSRDGREFEISFTPWTIGLHPTQIYETISTGLLVFLLLAWMPFRKRDGELIVILMFGYAIHRFLNEAIRNDTPNVAFGMTRAQNVSIVLFAGGLIVLWALRNRPPQYRDGVLLAPAGTPVDVPKATEEVEEALQD